MSVDTQLILKLRKITGAGVSDCQQALEESNGDIDAAIDFLRKKGALKAAKKAERETREGVIEARITQDKKSGLLLQIHCETDFVAKNKEFLDFVAGLAGQAVEGKETAVQIFEREKEGLILKTGENISFGRAEIITAEQVESYIHPNRKVGVLIGFSKKIDPVAARDVALHIAASAPTYLSAADIPKTEIERERKIYQDQAPAVKKPQAILDKIIDGKLQKFYQENCLLLQPFVKDETITVDKFLKLSGNAEIIKFLRYQIG